MALQWEVEPEQAFTELAEDYANRIHRGVFLICQRWAAPAANWMKENASWTDRTGNARAALYTEVNEVVNSMVEFVMAGGVDYQIWLEVRWAGKFAIVNPALDFFAPKVWADVQRLMSR